MPYLFLGIAVLAGALLAMRWFVDADPKTIVKVAKWLLLGIVGAVILFFIFTGRIAWAFWALPVLLPWLMRARTVARAAKNYSRMAGGGSGQTSTVTSAFLEMKLDHASGEMDGVVRKGEHAGVRLSDLDLAALSALYDSYSREDGESARLLAAYLDRVYPEWRGADPGGETAGDAGGSGGNAPMGRDEALRVLGLEGTPSTEEIKAAHHRLIAGLHPDKGGSAYLAAKINEARDVLLKS